MNNLSKIGYCLLPLIILTITASKISAQQPGQKNTVKKSVKSNQTQGGTISGSIADARTGEVLVGVSVWAPYLKVHRLLPFH